MSANVIVVKNPLAEEKEEDWGAALMGSAAVNKDLLFLPHRFKCREINEGSETRTLSCIDTFALIHQECPRADKKCGAFYGDKAAEASPPPSFSLGRFVYS